MKEELVEHITTSFFLNETLLECQGLSSTIWERHIHRSSGRILKKKGDYLIKVGDRPKGVHFIKSGLISTNFIGKDGLIKTCNMTGTGCVIGEQFFFHEQPSLFEARIVEDAELYYFENRVFLDLLKEDFNFNLFILKSLAGISRKLASQLQDISTRNTCEGISHILYSLACYEIQKGITTNITIKMSHQDLANLLGTHRVTITKNIRYLKDQGIIDYTYDKIVIKDTEKLKNMFSGE
ncbi:Crp/Fnr family transcriptional regulator [Desulfitobacterium sp. THU1]|uniref:Crp/Fnr family transcriptional regulator n=1 Tax=Desulfitobacterium sp. THU1 TaxID=3138072 RepID=UPI00311DCD37